MLPFPKTHALLQEGEERRCGPSADIIYCCVSHVFCGVCVAGSQDSESTFLLPCVHIFFELLHSKKLTVYFFSEGVSDTKIAQAVGCETNLDSVASSPSTLNMWKPVAGTHLRENNVAGTHIFACKFYGQCRRLWHRFVLQRTFARL